jgi:hypothetical protein
MQVFVEPLRAADLHYILRRAYPQLDVTTRRRDADAITRAGTVTQAHDEAVQRDDDVIAHDAARARSLLDRMVAFNAALCARIAAEATFARKGRPWYVSVRVRLCTCWRVLACVYLKAITRREFNLRDVFRWCELLIDKTRPFEDRTDDDDTAALHHNNSDDVRHHNSAASARVRFEPVDFVDVVYLQRLRTTTDRARVMQASVCECVCAHATLTCARMLQLFAAAFDMRVDDVIARVERARTVRVSR